MTIWFTSDNHFGHKNIIDYQNRPFFTVEEMDQVMIENWNKVVQPEDTVYHLGDLTLKGKLEARQYLKQLKGHVKILGNHWHHDKNWLPRWGEGHPYFGEPTNYQTNWEYGGTNVEILPPIQVLKFPQDGKYPQVIVLCHYAMAIWDLKHYGSWHLFGHSHGSYYSDDLCLDVGVDVRNFTPISLEQVKEIMKGK